MIYFALYTTRLLDRSEPFTAAEPGNLRFSGGDLTGSTLNSL